MRSLNVTSPGDSEICRCENRDLTRFSSNSRTSLREVRPITQIAACADCTTSNRLYSKDCFGCAQNKSKCSKMKMTLFDLFLLPCFRQASRKSRFSAFEPNTRPSTASFSSICVVAVRRAIPSSVSRVPSRRTITVLLTNDFSPKSEKSADDRSLEFSNVFF